MNTSDLEAAVRLVLPTLNLEPSQFRLDRGFLGRAERSSAPLGIALNNATNQLLYMGVHSNSDPCILAERLATDAFVTLSDPIRSVCKRFVVSWADGQGEVLAAAFAVSPTGAIGQLLGSSWSPPEEWPEPMVDAQESPDAAIARYLTRLQSSVRNRGVTPQPTFNRELQRLLQLIALTLQRVGGESQDRLAIPPEEATDQVWATWLKHFAWSTEDEWNRKRGTHQRRAPILASSPSDGPLKGLRIFLSYARPDAASLAWPVDEALTSYGARVWFDQEQLPDEQQLNSGFSETIGDCDAYIMCASDEFMERAGYATQELAWALQRGTANVRTKHFVVVAEPGTILPSAIASWPVVEFNGQDTEGLARDLASRLLQPQDLAKVLVAPQPRTESKATFVPIQLQDISSLRRRAEHVDRFDAIPQKILQQIATTDKAEDDQEVMEVRHQLMRIGDGLEWSGTLQDIDRWPDDPMVRDLRLRLASARAVAGTRWPLSGDLDSELGIADDVEYLVTRPVPVCGWPTAPGWDDSERRFALRHHAGLLRLLQVLLRRGLTGGILRLPSSKWDEYADALSNRRRECIEMVLDLRIAGRLSWQEEPPMWDKLFRVWRKFLLYEASWRDPVPFWIMQLLGANATVVAAAGAETGWCASRHPKTSSLSATLHGGIGNPITIDVYAQPSAVSSSEEAFQNAIQLGLVATPKDGAELRLSWNGPGLFGESPVGHSSSPAPIQLRRALNLPSC